MKGVTMLKDGYCMCLNAWTLDTRIKNELPLLLIISSLCSKTGNTFASNKYFAELFSCTETSISCKIRHLYECGYIEIEYEKRGSQIIHRNLRIKNISSDRLKNFNWTDKKNLKDNNISNNNKDLKNIYMSEFEEFWKIYPKQRAGSKEKAYKAYCKVIQQKKITIDKLLEVCVKYAQSDEVKRGYAKGCAAWLNDERFNNEYTVRLSAPEIPPEKPTQWWSE